MTKQPDRLYLFDGLSRDSSQITIATLPQTAQIHGDSSMMNTTLGSKCNLLDECSIVGILPDDSVVGGGTGTDQDDDVVQDSSDDTQMMLKRGDNDSSPPPNERYLAVLKDNYKSSCSRGVSPKSYTVLVANGGKNVASKRDIGKSQSLDKLEFKQQQQQQHSNDEAGDESSTKEISSKRPASFSQSVHLQYHQDSSSLQQRLNSNNSCDDIKIIANNSQQNFINTKKENSTVICHKDVVVDGVDNSNSRKNVKPLKFSEVRV